MDIFSYFVNEHRDKWKKVKLLEIFAATFKNEVLIFFYIKKKIKTSFLNYMI